MFTLWQFQNLGPLAVGSDAGSDPGIHSTIPEHGALSCSSHGFPVAPTFSTHNLLSWDGFLGVDGQVRVCEVKQRWGAGQRSAQRGDVKLTVTVTFEWRIPWKEYYVIHYVISAP